MSKNERQLSNRIRKMVWGQPPDVAADLERRERALNNMGNRGYHVSKRQREQVLDERHNSNPRLQQLYNGQLPMPIETVLQNTNIPQLPSQFESFKPILVWANQKNGSGYSGTEWLVVDMLDRIYSMDVKNSYDAIYSVYSKGIIVQERYLVTEVDMNDPKFVAIKRNLEQSLRLSKHVNIPPAIVPNPSAIVPNPPRSTGVTQKIKKIGKSKNDILLNEDLENAIASPKIPADVRKSYKNFIPHLKGEKGRNLLNKPHSDLEFLGHGHFKENQRNKLETLENTQKINVC